MVSSFQKEPNRLCATCNSELPPSVKYCVKCGTRRQPVTEVQESAKTHTPFRYQPEVGYSDGRTCPNCRTPMGSGQSACVVCGTTFQAQESSKPIQRAAFCTRFVAFVLDNLLLGVVWVIVWAILARLTLFPESAVPLLVFVLSIPISVALYILYDATLTKLYGGTLGKRLLGIRVVSRNGESLNWTESIIRAFLKVLSSAFFIYIVSGILAAFRDDKRSLHDLAIGSSVINKRS